MSRPRANMNQAYSVSMIGRQYLSASKNVQIES